MDVVEVVGRVKSGYNERVKPLIECEDYDGAWVQMGEIMMRDVLRNSELIRDYKSGPNMINSIKGVLEDLADRRISDSKVEMFEVFLNQLELAVKTGNKF